MHDAASVTTPPEAAAGRSRLLEYSKLVLGLYDLEVLGFELPVIFGCPARRILELYDANVSDAHLDVGVGTGYFLEKILGTVFARHTVTVVGAMALFAARA